MHLKGQVTPASILEELVLYAQAEPDETEGFCHRSHNSELRPRFLEKTERILSAFEKYVPLKYELQAPHGAEVEGADIIARYWSERIANGEERRIALRITLLDEFQSKDELLEKIKADISRLEKDSEGRLDRYYLLLCTDQRRHGERVRAISAELKAGNTAVTVVEPAYAWFFFAMEDAMIDAVTDKLLYPEDYVRCQAREQVAGIGKRKLILLLSCLINAIEERNGFTVSDDFLMQDEHVHEFEADDAEGRGRLSEDVAAMEGTFFFRDADVDGFGIYQDSVSAIVAMYYDAKVRYGHTGDDAVHYLHTFLEQSAWSSA
jgi:hypothetical protein